MWLLLLQILWFLAPAYIANGAPVIIKGHTPIDRGKYLGKERILGDGKTIEGFIGGALSGILTGLILLFIQEWLPISPTFKHNIFTILLLSIGAVSGDVLGSFIKRRLKIKRGAPCPLLDQLDFLLFPLLVLMLTGKIFNLKIYLIMIILTIVLHVTTNYIAYKLKLKDVPW